MPSSFVKFKGEVHWARTITPELSPFTEPGKPPKSQWNVQFRPDKDHLMPMMDLQSKGVKNQLKKTEDGTQYYMNFHRPTEIKARGSMVKMDPPKITLNGEPFNELLGNGTKGEITIEIYEHGTPGGGKSHAARFHGFDVTDLVKYEGSTTEAATGF